MGFNRNRSFNRRVETFRAVCDNCGKNCDVPFKPTNGKPIYCSSCFESRRPDSDKRSEGRGFNRPNFDNRSNAKYEEQFALLNSKLDQVLSILQPIAQEVEEEIEEKKSE